MAREYSWINQLLKNRINMNPIPFTERGSRLLLFCAQNKFAVRMAERWVKLDGKLTSYRTRPPLLDEWMFLDDEGQPLELKLTTYPHCIECDTRIGQFVITFLDTESLLIILPTGKCGISFRAHLDKCQLDRRGGVLNLTGNIRRNVAYTTNAKIISNQIIPADENCQSVRMVVSPDVIGRSLLLNMTPRLGYNRWIPNFDKALVDAEQRWYEWFNNVPEVDSQYQWQYYYAWWVMRAGLISTRYYTTREVMMPSKVHYVGVWQWDNLFHALAYQYVDTKLAEDQIRILLDHQREDGMIPDAIYDEGTVTHLDYPVEADVTKPPLLAWVAWKLYEQSGDIEFLNEIYESVVRWNKWWHEKNDLDMDGLCEYQHPFSSGLDDSPLWDNGMPVTSPDLNTYICLQEEALARIAREIGEKADSKRWEQASAEHLRQLIRNMWDADKGLFWAYHNGKKIDVMTPINLFPLFISGLPHDIAIRLVDNLMDRNTFWSRYPIPTVALNDPHFNPCQMWRGPTWININYLFVDGLFRCGFPEQARKLRQRTLELIAGQDDICEYYHPVTGEKCPDAAPIFGWSAALYIDFAVQASREMTTR